jgi:protein phosphatase
MQISIFPPQYFWETGGRDNNEDYMYPPPENHAVSENDTLFLVCDGVGGAQKGEVASRMACEQLVHYFQSKPTDVSTESYITSAVAKAQDYFNAHQTLNPESRGMATTLTLLHLHEAGATIMHMGDSRVYQIRDGEIRFKTRDHNLINDMLASGAISEEEARNHPKKNIITRALQAGSDAPVRPEVKNITDDIEPGDYFFLCSDGVLETMSDAELCSILSKRISNEEKIAAIKAVSVPHSKDNCTACLVQIKSVNGTVSAQHAALLHPPAPLAPPPPPPMPATASPRANSNNGILYALLGMAVVAVFLAVYLLWPAEPATPNVLPADSTKESQTTHPAQTTPHKTDVPSHNGSTTRPGPSEKPDTGSERYRDETETTGEKIDEASKGLKDTPATTRNPLDDLKNAKIPGKKPQEKPKTDPERMGPNLPEQPKSGGGNDLQKNISPKKSANIKIDSI